MADQELKDRKGNLLGKIRTLSNGKLEGKDARGNLKGTYDTKRDETKDSRGNLVGKGNLLSSLITQL